MMIVIFHFKLNIMRVEKPFKPKLEFSEFSITKALLEMNYNTYFIIGEKNFSEFKSRNSKTAKKLFRKHFKKEKILIIKKKLTNCLVVTN